MTDQEWKGNFQRWADFSDDVDRDLNKALESLYDPNLNQKEKLNAIFNTVETIREYIVNSDYDYL